VSRGERRVSRDSFYITCGAKDRLHVNPAELDSPPASKMRFYQGSLNHDSCA